jgi:tetratricopeptide (TPR) repeat protein
MLNLIKLFGEQPPWFVSSRFRYAIVVAIMALIISFVPIPGMGWLGFVLIVLSGGIGIRATWLLPHERRKIRRAEQWLDHLELENIKNLKNRAIINGVAFAIKRDLLLARCCFKEGDWLGAYAAIQDAGSHYLLPHEAAKYKELKGLLFFNVNNRRDFLNLFGESQYNIPNRVGNTSAALLKSYWQESQGNLPLAKAELENALFESQDRHAQIVLYNNLARLEKLSGNFQEQISYFTKAATLLKKNPVPALYHIVYHNLAVNLAQEGRKQEAIQIIYDYYNSINKNNVLQYLNYSNDYLILARELNDQDMIDQAHAHNNELLSMQLSKSQQVSLRISSLRMIRNDLQPKFDYLTEIKELVRDVEELSNNEQLAGLLEIVHDIRFELDDCSAGKSPTDPDLLYDVFTSAVKRLLEFHSFIDIELQETPPVLPSVRAQWLRRRHALLKLEISLQRKISKHNFKKMFDNLEEIASIWRDKQCESAEIEILMIICDEFVAYRQDLNSHFQQDFEHRAINAYKSAEELLLTKLERPEFHSQLIGMAYFALKLNMGREAVGFWFDCANRHNISLRHYAAWLRGQYFEVKDFLAQERAKLT